jgi:hypothetical protein
MAQNGLRRPSSWFGQMAGEAHVLRFWTADQERKKNVPTERLGGGKLTRTKHSFRWASLNDDVRALAPPRCKEGDASSPAGAGH